MAQTIIIIILQLKLQYKFCEFFALINDHLFPLQCALTLRDSDANTTDAISGIFCYCCWNNQTFSASVISDIQVHACTCTCIYFVS